MSRYTISHIRIENGVITSEFCGKTATIKGFFTDKAPVIDIFPVNGWKFSRVYLTHGDQENGSGWAFRK
jgi:hypothetical protein